MAAPRETTRGGTGERPAEPGRRWGLPDALILAVAAGLFCGTVEVTALGWRRSVLGFFTHITPHVAWMAPIGYAALFLILAPLLHALRFARGPAPQLAVYAALGLVGWLEMSPWALHPLAAWLLAVAIAVQLGRLASARPARLRRLAAIAGPVLSIVAAVGAVRAFSGELRGGAPLTAEDPLAVAETGAETRPARPNVLLLLLDTVRAKSLGLYGGDAGVSPRIDRLAAESIVFDRAISPAPWTLPSHASMFTGRWPHELSVGWVSPLDDAEPTLAEALAGEGYATAGFVANLIYTPRLFGLARGFEHYEDFPISVGQVVLATSLGRSVTTADRLRAWSGRHELLNRKTAARLRRDFLGWLDRSADPPFFAFLNFYDAHEPYEPPEPFRERFAPGFERSDMRHQHDLWGGVQARRVGKWTMSGPEIAGELALYEASIASLDAEIGALLDALEDRGLLDRTVLIVTSDHGEQFGEHGLFDHLQSLYQPLTHVPLLIRLPGARWGGTRVAAPVSLVDLSATVLDLVAADREAWPGRSLRRAWSAPAGTGPAIAAGAGPRTRAAGDGPVSPGAGAARETSPAISHLAQGLVEAAWYPIARGPEMFAWVRGSVHYICNPDGGEELYELTADPAEIRNLAGTSAADSLRAGLREAAGAVGHPARAIPCLSSPDPGTVPLAAADSFPD